MGRSSSGKQIAVLLGATKLDHLSTHCISCEHQQPPNPKATNGKQQHIAGLEASHGLRWFVGFPRRLCSGTGDASFAWWQAQPHTLGGCKSGSGARLTASSASLQELAATKSSAKLCNQFLLVLVALLVLGQAATSKAHTSSQSLLFPAIAMLTSYIP